MKPTVINSVLIVTAVVSVLAGLKMACNIPRDGLLAPLHEHKESGNTAGHSVETTVETDPSIKFIERRSVRDYELTLIKVDGVSVLILDAQSKQSHPSMVVIPASSIPTP